MTQTNTPVQQHNIHPNSFTVMLPFQGITKHANSHKILPNPPVNRSYLPPITTLSYGIQTKPSPSKETDCYPMGVENLNSSRPDIRAHHNHQAILELKRVQAGEEPDPDILRNYSGGGGLGESTDEYYTPLIAAQVMVSAAGHWNPYSRVLDPACGIGSLLARTPKTTYRVGLELSKISAEIASHLMPEASIVNTAAERYFTTSDDPLFDVVLCNPPYGPRHLRHLDEKNLKKNEHYFALKSLERVHHHSGVAVLLLRLALTTEDAHQAWRQEMCMRGRLIGHSVLPQSTFKKEGAGVTTVILTFVRHDIGVYEALQSLKPDEMRKLFATRDADNFIKGTGIVYEAQYNYNGNKKTLQFTNYSGNACLSDKRKLERGGRFGEIILEGELQVTDETHESISDTIEAEKRRGGYTLNNILSSIAALFGEERARTAADAARNANMHPIPYGKISPDGQYVMTKDGWQVTDDFSKGEVLDAIQIGMTISKAKNAESENESAWGLWRTAVRLDEDYRRKYGTYDLKNLSRLSQRFGILALLISHLTEEGLLIGKEQTSIPYLAGSPADVAEQLCHMMALTTPELMRQTSLDKEECEQLLLANYCFNGSIWMRSELYYSGNAYLQSDHCRKQAARLNGAERQAMLRQADEFLKQIKPLSLEEVSISPRDPSVPLAALEGFVNSYLGTITPAGRMLITLDRVNGATKFIFAHHGVTRSRYNNPRKETNEQAIKDLLSYLNHKTRLDLIKGASMMSDQERQAERAVAIEEAKAYEEQVVLAFNTWLASYAQNSEVLEAYNTAHRAHLVPSSLTLPIPLHTWKGPVPHPYQNHAVWRMSSVSGMILGDDVGLGKTFTALLLIGYLKHVGHTARPVIVVPAGLIGNWASSAARALPTWNVMTIGMSPRKNKAGEIQYKKKKNGTVMTNERGEPIIDWHEDSANVKRSKLADLAAGKSDLVIMSRDTFTNIPMSETNRQRLIEHDVQYIARLERTESFDFKNARARHATLTRINNFIGKCNARLKAAGETDLLFEHLGIDLVCFDEMHGYKNLYSPPVTYGETPKFLGGGAESNRALDAVHKARLIRQQGGRTYGLTASWVKNSPLEIHSMASVITDNLNMYGITTVEDLMEHFIEIEPRIITTLEGEVKVKPAVTGFRRMTELGQLIDCMVLARKAGDPQVIKADGTPLHVPKIREVEITIDMTDQQRALYDELRKEARGEEQNKDKYGEGETDKFHIFSIMSRMRRLTVDPALMGIKGKNPRFEAITKEAIRIRQNGGKSLVFLSIGEKEGAFQRLKDTLVKAGYPEDEIAIVTGTTHKNSVQRQNLEDDYNHGDVSLILGSEVLAEGFNLQRGTHAIIHGDIPWNREGIRQRNGRGGRQGNEVDEVESIYILMRGSFDIITYTIMRGKCGWQDQLDGKTERMNNDAAEIGLEELALMLSEDPEKTRQEIQNRKEELTELSETVVMKKKLQNVMQATVSRTLLKTAIARANKRKEGWTQTDYLRVGELKQAYQRAMLKVENSDTFPMSAVVTFKHKLIWRYGMPFHEGMTFDHGEVSYVIKHIGENEVSVQQKDKYARSTFTFRQVIREGKNHKPSHHDYDYDQESALEGIKLANVVIPSNATVIAMNAHTVKPTPKSKSVLSVSVENQKVRTVPSQSENTLLMHIKRGNTIIHYLTKDDVEGMIIEQVVILCRDDEQTNQTKRMINDKKASMLERLKSIAKTALTS